MTVDKFCGCGNLETGGLVVGVTGILSNAFLIYIILPLVLQKYDVYQFNDGNSNLMIILLIFCFVCLIASIVLIIGTEKVIF